MYALVNVIVIVIVVSISIAYFNIISLIYNIIIYLKFNMYPCLKLINNSTYIFNNITKAEFTPRFRTDIPHGYIFKAFINPERKSEYNARRVSCVQIPNIPS